MAARKVARWLAPLALVAVIAAVYVVVHKTLAPKHKPAAVATHAITIPTTKKGSGRGHSAPHHHSYVVKSGDSLSGIAVKMKTSVSTLESLNPKVNPNALQTGERLTLP